MLNCFSRVWVFATLWTPTRLLCPWDSPGKNTEVGCIALLQGISLAQGLNPHLLCLLHCSWILYHCFPGGSDGKESACNEGDLGSIPGWGRSPGEGNSNPLQDSCLENPIDGGAWWATYSPWGRKESDMTSLSFTLFTTESYFNKKKIENKMGLNCN